VDTRAYNATFMMPLSGLPGQKPLTKRSRER
jgi:hypothetical protein